MALLNDVYEIGLYSRRGEQLGINVLHYRVSNVIPPGPSDQEIANAFQTAYDSQYQALLSTNATFVGATAQKIRPLPSGPTFQSTGPPISGLDPGDVLPNQVSGLLRVRTAGGGRRARGRIYIPFPSESANESPGIPTTPYLANLQALATALIAAISILGAVGSATLNIGVFSRVDNLQRDATAIDTRPLWATQRRRGGFGATNPGPFPAPG